MNKKVEFKTITQEIVKYEALDGTIFDSEDECKKYEATAKCAINGAFNAIPQVDYNGNCIQDIVLVSYDDTIRAIYIEDVNTLEVVNRWLEINGCNHGLSAKDIGTVSLIATDYDSEFVWILGTPEEYKKKFCDYIDNHFVNPLMKKIEEDKKSKEEN